MKTAIEIPTPLAKYLEPLAETIGADINSLATALLLRYLGFHMPVNANDPVQAFSGSQEARSISERVNQIQVGELPTWIAKNDVPEEK